MLNPIDYKILDLLQHNARMTQSEIAASVGLSQPAVAERMKKLEQEGVITAYAARVDSRKLGKDITAFIGVRIEHPKYNKEFSRRMLLHKEALLASSLNRLRETRTLTALRAACRAWARRKSARF